MLNIRRGTNLSPALFPANFKDQAHEALKTASSEDAAKIKYELGLYEATVTKDIETALQYFVEVLEFAKQSNHWIGGDAIRQMLQTRLQEDKLKSQTVTYPGRQWVKDNVPVHLMGELCQGMDAQINMVVVSYDCLLTELYLRLMAIPSYEIPKEMQDGIRGALAQANELEPIVEDQGEDIGLHPDAIEGFRSKLKGLRRAAKLLDE